MSNYGDAELYFIAGMMFLILIFAGVAMYFFFRQLRKEKREAAERKLAKEAAEMEAARAVSTAERN